MTRKSAAAEAQPPATVTEKPNILSQALQAAGSPTSSPALPSGNIEHAIVLVNELENRLFGFRSGIIALQGELDGSQKVFEDDIAELNQKIADRTAKREIEKADLLRRLADLQRGERILSAGIDAAGPLPEKPE